MNNINIFVGILIITILYIIYNNKEKYEDISSSDYIMYKSSEINNEKYLASIRNDILTLNLESNVIYNKYNTETDLTIKNGLNSQLTLINEKINNLKKKVEIIDNANIFLKNENTKKKIKEEIDKIQKNINYELSEISNLETQLKNL